MNWLNKLERKFGRFSIPGLPKYIILLYVVGIMVQFAAPELYSQFTLNPTLYCTDKSGGFLRSF